ncbi:FBD domain-containing protein [Heracleum sosnowskyi]|uniref:FBD domain-containing protein n=1 Tax=Heracleum sosnowskyi TaxID=360622 RepID=A0AAD8IL18_9APIA|nr:FBD domain-containing protein [Heracleum sosnowskyi]
MGSSSVSKKLKISEVEVEVEVDRISTLPDSLLLKILDSLPTKRAVCTSVLSKRWRPLYMSLPNLEFYDRYGKNPKQFSKFVDRFFMQRSNGLKIDKFELLCGEDYYLDRVDEWILKAIGRDLKELHLNFWFKDLYEVFHEVYMCSTLEALRLACNILVYIPEDVKFSRLRVLKFSKVTFGSIESAGELLLNCPVLEDFSIDECEWLSGHCLSICGNALKKLSLLNGSDPIDNEFFLEILIDTPALEYLGIESFVSDDILIKGNLQFLTTAYLDVEQIIEGALPSNVFGDCVFGLLKKINHVKILTLGGKTVEAFNSVYDCEFQTVHEGFPLFHNLTELDLRVETYCGDLLSDFLKNTRNLKSLEFPWGLVDTSTDSWHFSWSWPSSVPECLSTHLQTLDIGQFYGTHDELSLVEFFLNYGSALRNVSVDASNLCNGGGAEVQEELLSYHRESTNCKLDISF